MEGGLTKEVIDKINSVFVLFPEIYEVILFGSRAKGNFRKGSDIDLSLKGESIDLNLLNEVETKLSDLMLPYTIDIAVYNNIKVQELKEHISRVGISFYQKKKNAAKNK